MVLEDAQRPRVNGSSAVCVEVVKASGWRMEMGMENPGRLLRCIANGPCSMHDCARSDHAIVPEVEFAG